MNVFHREENLFRATMTVSKDSGLSLVQVSLTQVEINELFSLAAIGGMAHIECQSSRRREYEVWDGSGRIRSQQLTVGFGFDHFYFDAATETDNIRAVVCLEEFSIAVKDCSFSIPNVSDFILAEHFLDHAMRNTDRPGELA